MGGLNYDYTKERNGFLKSIISQSEGGKQLKNGLLCSVIYHVHGSMTYFTIFSTFQHILAYFSIFYQI